MPELLQTLQTQVAVLERSLNDCQRTAADCREGNREAHGEFYRRIGAVELEVGKLGVRVGMWAAVGSIVGGGVVGLVVQLLQGKLGGG